MVEGRLRKFYEEVVLLSQAFVLDPETTVDKALAATEQSVGAPIKITGFHRFALGEGIERPDSDFAAEVAARRPARRVAASSRGGSAWHRASCVGGQRAHDGPIASAATDSVLLKLSGEALLGRTASASTWTC